MDNQIFKLFLVIKKKKETVFLNNIGTKKNKRKREKERERKERKIKKLRPGTRLGENDMDTYPVIPHRASFVHQLNRRWKKKNHLSGN